MLNKLEDGEQLKGGQLLLLLRILLLADGQAIGTTSLGRIDLNNLLALEKAEPLEKAKEKASLELIMALPQCLMDKCKCMIGTRSVGLSDQTNVLTAGRLDTGKISAPIKGGLGLSKTGINGMPARMASRANSTSKSSDGQPGCQT